MNYIVLELFPEPCIVTNMDGEVWKTDLKTARELASECQEGMVVPLDTQFIGKVLGSRYDNTLLQDYFNDTNT